MANGILSGKKGLIMGVANDHSIAWGIASQCHAQGADLAFTFQGEALEKRVRPLAESVGSKLVLPCDVTNEESLDDLFANLRAEWGKIDFVVHAIAFSDRNELKGRYADTSAGNFANSMLISCYSFTNICKRAAELMPEGGAMLTLTYFGSEKWLPNYNVMGVAKAALESSVRYLANDLGKDAIRVNAISSGPVKTLAASGVSDFRTILNWNENNAPLRRNVTLDEVGNAAVFLVSDMASAITGEIVHVDCGYNTIGMVAMENAPENAELLAKIAKSGEE